MRKFAKFAIEMGPLLIFFLFNSQLGIIPATGAFIVATVASMIASYLLFKKIAIMLWVSGIVVAIFGGATIYFNDETFIKLKPTIVYMLFAGVLFTGILLKRSFLKVVMDAAFPPLSDEGWRIMTVRWAWFFVAMAILNEIVWRNFDTDIWVNFKVFGALPISFIFAMCQMPVINRHMLDAEPVTETDNI